MELPILLLQDTLLQQKEQLNELERRNTNPNAPAFEFRKKATLNVKRFIAELEEAIEALTLLSKQKQALILPVIGKSFNASFKVGDKVLKAGVFDAQIIEELKPNVFKIKYPDGYEMLAITEDLVLATESI